MKKKAILFVKKHPFFMVIIAFLLLIILPPLLINVLYKVQVFWCIPQNEIPAGNLLSYFGTVLTFCATFSLSIVIFIQNRENAKKILLLDNQVFITINDDSLMEITVIDGGSDLTSVSFSFNIIVLSKSNISDIYLRYLSFDFDRFSESAEKHIIVNNSKWKVVHFQRGVTETELSVTITDISKELIALLEVKRNFVVIMEMSIKSNDVVTPVKITVKLNKLQEKCSVIKSVCSYEFKFINHGNPFIVNK